MTGEIQQAEIFQHFLDQIDEANEFGQFLRLLRVGRPAIDVVLDRVFHQTRPVLQFAQIGEFHRERFELIRRFLDETEGHLTHQIGDAFAFRRFSVGQFQMNAFHRRQRRRTDGKSGEKIRVLFVAKGSFEGGGNPDEARRRVVRQIFVQLDQKAFEQNEIQNGFRVDQRLVPIVHGVKEIVDVGQRQRVEEKNQIVTDVVLSEKFQQVRRILRSDLFAEELGQNGTIQAARFLVHLSDFLQFRLLLVVRIEQMDPAATDPIDHLPIFPIVQNPVQMVDRCRRIELSQNFQIVVDKFLLGKHLEQIGNRSVAPLLADLFPPRAEQVEDSHGVLQNDQTRSLVRRQIFVANVRRRNFARRKADRADSAVERAEVNFAIRSEF